MVVLQKHKFGMFLFISVQPAEDINHRVSCQVSYVLFEVVRLDSGVLFAGNARKYSFQNAQFAELCTCNLQELDSLGSCDERIFRRFFRLRLFLANRDAVLHHYKKNEVD